MQIRLDFFDLLLFAVMVSFFVIGIHQSIYHGVAASYWLFMFSMLAFLWLNKRLKEKKADKGSDKEAESKKKSGKRK
jgi:peptidoglycan/LPS O-acetylase OafA/YrhL